MIIKEIQDNVFNHLRKNHPNIYFTLRKIDKGGRLRNGYWFLGNDDYLSFSFWQGTDWQHKTSNINYFIRANGSTTMQFVDKEKQAIKKKFFEKIAKTFKMTPHTPKMGIINIWYRDYSPPNTDYLKTLDDFIQNDKVLLDTLISVSEVRGCTNNNLPAFHAFCR